MVDLSNSSTEIGQNTATTHKDHFVNLQSAIDSIEMSNSVSYSEMDEMPTLGEILSYSETWVQKIILDQLKHLNNV